ncbi:site-specific integrase [Pseudomonas quasicaspiana]|uniref:integrase n=1 Tax=Pseudomonas quasicaspiana TaxID=2829821 RepID=UPI001E2D5BB9|nr:integrase [Pseudomonas quasicaspiana]MCD5973279.1 integrase [Pseudomonas quasicaspiana]
MEITLATNCDLNSDVADLQSISAAETNLKVISAVKIDGEWVVVSRFGDDNWQVGGHPKNISRSHAMVNFNKFPEAYRQTVKEISYVYLMRGRERTRKPKGSSLTALLNHLIYFTRYLEKLEINDLSKIPPFVFSNYAHECRSAVTFKNEPIGKSSICRRLLAVEALHELSHYTNTSLGNHPWPESSALALAGLTGENGAHKQQKSTPLIPDDVFSIVFEKAYDHVMRGDYLLDIKEELDEVNNRLKQAGHEARLAERSRILSHYGYENDTASLLNEVRQIRIACYIVIASTSGCRNHEIFNLQNGAHRKTVEDDGETYHWMRSESEKTYSGVCDWMIPPSAVRALRLMEKWATPYQNMIAKEIARLRKENPLDPEIAEARKHLNSLFLGSANNSQQVRTLSVGSCNKNLNSFIESLDLGWNLTSHQFRKKFANYVAHSKFGDLRYLKEHFKHWSMDMTLTYAIDESWGDHFDLELFSEIESELADIKTIVVDSWTQSDHLSGGYGENIRAWRRDPMNLAIFCDHSTMVKSIAETTAIRSNGHAWCTADETGCVGNTLEPSRCTGCNNAVIGEEHAPIYEGLYFNMLELLECADIGEAGMLRVKRDLERYTKTLKDLGLTLDETVE